MVGVTKTNITSHNPSATASWTAANWETVLELGEREVAAAVAEMASSTRRIRSSALDEATSSRPFDGITRILDSVLASIDGALNSVEPFNDVAVRSAMAQLDLLADDSVSKPQRDPQRVGPEWSERLAQVGPEGLKEAEPDIENWYASILGD